MTLNTSYVRTSCERNHELRIEVRPRGRFDDLANSIGLVIRVNFDLRQVVVPCGVGRLAPYPLSQLTPLLRRVEQPDQLNLLAESMLTDHKDVLAESPSNGAFVLCDVSLRDRLANFSTFKVSTGWVNRPSTK